MYTRQVKGALRRFMKATAFPMGQHLLGSIRKMTVASKAHNLKKPKVLSKSKNKKPLLAQLRDRPYAIKCEAEDVD